MYLSISTRTASLPVMGERERRKETGGGREKKREREREREIERDERKKMSHAGHCIII